MRVGAHQTWMGPTRPHFHFRWFLRNFTSRVLSVVLMVPVLGVLLSLPSNALLSHT